MTSQSEIIGNKDYIPVLDHGFVGLVDYMGDDAAIVQAARVSYGAGTKKVSEDRGLIRYLVRHKHTTPLEMVEFKFHMKLPIFVARQLVRHRTASINEYSGRYSEMTNEFYIPDINRIQPQSQLNKQGSDGVLHPLESLKAKVAFKTVAAEAYEVYEDLMREGPVQHHENEEPTEVVHHQGVSRELARTVLPVSNYTEWYWKMDLHNLVHFLKLRMDSHAQWEIQEFARAAYELVKDIVPHAMEAANDFIFEGASLSRMEVKLIKDLIAVAKQHSTLYTDEKAFQERYELTGREWLEFKKRFDL